MCRMKIKKQAMILSKIILEIHIIHVVTFLKKIINSLFMNYEVDVRLKHPAG